MADCCFEMGLQSKVHLATRVPRLLTHIIQEDYDPPHCSSLSATGRTFLGRHLEWHQIVGSSIWLPGDALSSRTLPVLPFNLFSRLGIICRFTCSEARVFRDRSNFSGWPMGTHYGCFKKSAMHWRLHVMRERQEEAVLKKTTFFNCLKPNRGATMYQQSRNKLEPARKVPEY